MKTFWFEMGLIFGTNQINLFVLTWSPLIKETAQLGHTPKNVFVDTYRSSWIFKYHLDVIYCPKSGQYIEQAALMSAEYWTKWTLAHSGRRAQQHNDDSWQTLSFVFLITGTEICSTLLKLEICFGPLSQEGMQNIFQFHQLFPVKNKCTYLWLFDTYTLSCRLSRNLSMCSCGMSPSSWAR